MPRTHHVALLAACLAVATAVGCSTAPDKPTPPVAAAPAAADEAAMPLDDRHIMAFTKTGTIGDPLAGRALFNNSVARLNPWEFKNNARNCASCHILADGLGLGRQTAYNASPTSPLIAAVLADGDPDVDFSTPRGQQLKRVMLDQLREVGLIRIVLPNPNFDAAEGENPENPKFIRTWRSVPTLFNAALGFIEDEPKSQGGFLNAFVMWDGRESSLEHQAASATLGHAQTKLQEGPVDPRQAVNSPTGLDIARFEKEAFSLPRSLAKLAWKRPKVDHYFDGTKWEGAPVFSMETVQQQFFGSVKLTTDAQKRGMKLFVQHGGKPACITCHNMPHSLAGGTRLFADARIARENRQIRLHAPDAATRALLESFGFELEGHDEVPFVDPITGEVDLPATNASFGHDLADAHLMQKLPKQKLRLKKDDGTYKVVETQDPGLAGQTGMLRDFGKFKITQLRGIKGFTRFFHDNHDTLDLEAVVEHYESVLPNLDFNAQERHDLVEFLEAL